MAFSVPHIRMVHLIKRLNIIVYTFLESRSIIHWGTLGMSSKTRGYYLSLQEIWSSQFRQWGIGKMNIYYSQIRQKLFTLRWNMNQKFEYSKSLFSIDHSKLIFFTGYFFPPQIKSPWQKSDQSNFNIIIL